MRKHSQIFRIMMPFVTMTTTLLLLMMMMMTGYTSVNAVSNQRL